MVERSERKGPALPSKVRRGALDGSQDRNVRRQLGRSLRSAICKWWFSDEELRDAVSRIERADDNVIRKAREAAQEAKDDQSQDEVEQENEDE